MLKDQRFLKQVQKCTCSTSQCGVTEENTLQYGENTFWNSWITRYIM